MYIGIWNFVFKIRLFCPYLQRGNATSAKKVNGKVHFLWQFMQLCQGNLKLFFLCPSRAWAFSCSLVLCFLLGDGYILKPSSCFWPPLREETTQILIQVTAMRIFRQQGKEAISFSYPCFFFHILLLTNQSIFLYFPVSACKKGKLSNDNTRLRPNTNVCKHHTRKVLITKKAR